MPFGILDVLSGLLTIIFGTSRETSDFIADCLQQWWDENRERYTHIRQLVINLDNGPENSGFRTQFMQRMIEFAERNGLEIGLVYYPPYHSNIIRLERERRFASVLFQGASNGYFYFRDLPQVLCPLDTGPFALLEFR